LYLDLNIVTDLGDALSRVESALRELYREGRAGKTISNYAEALAAFCDWCVERSYLERDPLKKFKGFDTTPQTQRRAMTIVEMQKLLAVSPGHRALLWETALLSGLRADELRHLSKDHLDEHGLHLDASWTKNRKGGFLPLPKTLIERLQGFDEAIDRYRTVYKEIPSFIPEHPLLYVPRDPARELDKDLAAAGIPKYTKEGKLDFHALRVTYINLVIESGVTIKEAQALARHTTPQMTMNIYGRTREERLIGAVEKIAQHVTSMSEAEHMKTQTIENINGSAHLSGGFKSPLRHSETDVDNSSVHGVTCTNNVSVQLSDRLPQGHMPAPLSQQSVMAYRLHFTISMVSWRKGIALCRPLFVSAVHD
jgi:integrase